MIPAELTRIDRSIEIQAPPERVWRALTDVAELSAWFQVKIEGPLTAGSEVWMTSVHPDHAGQRWPVRIVELTDTDPPGPTMAQVRAAKEQEQKLVLFERAKAHPVVKQALEI